MGLAEKRKLAECQEQMDGWKQQVEAVCGKTLSFDVQWEQLVKENFLDYYPVTISHNFFNPLEDALKSVCADKMGKESFTQKINNVKITCQRTKSSLQAKVEGDTLHLDADPTYGKTADDTKAYAKTITTALEKAL